MFIFYVQLLFDHVSIYTSIKIFKNSHQHGYTFRYMMHGLSYSVQVIGQLHQINEYWMLTRISLLKMSMDLNIAYTCIYKFSYMHHISNAAWDIYIGYIGSQQSIAEPAIILNELHVHFNNNIRLQSTKNELKKVSLMFFNS